MKKFYGADQVNSFIKLRQPGLQSVLLFQRWMDKFMCLPSSKAH